MIKERYLGVEVCRVNMKETLVEIDNIIQTKKPSFIVAINPEKIMKAVYDNKLKNLLNSADIQIPDGIGVVLASKLKRKKIKTRVTGIDLMDNICKMANNKNYRIFMLGAKPGIAEKAAGILNQKYENINIVGIVDGYFKNEQLVLEEVINAQPDILFVALGSPAQEYWITNNMSKLKVPISMGVGGSFDVICGNIERAPQWMCKFGIEWLFRLIKEPWRFKRMLVLPVFLVKVIFERV
jgi:N-acetylglucosaminyldiphosphoundecaprenol N-acetyl-beta-D-mannosaminyltransferase